MSKHVFAGSTRLVTKLGKQPRDDNNDGIPDSIAGCDREPWGWSNGNGNGGCGNYAGNGNGNGPEIWEKDQYYYHPDHLGSTSYVTDVDGEIFQHLEYFPFGETFVEEASNTQRTPHLFTAKELDEETGLYYFGARYYDPRTSVWQSTDPALQEYLPEAPSWEDPSQNIPNLPGKGGVFQPVNLAAYSYAHQSPLKLKDPNGEWVEDVFIGVPSIALGVYSFTGNVWNGNWGAAALDAGGIAADAAAIATPGVPGGAGFGIRATRKGAEAVARRSADDAASALARACSFHGDTLVKTERGLIPISDVMVGNRVWSRNPETGEMAWKGVLAAYSNSYAETVWITIHDLDTGAEQVILSNRIHPFFVQIPLDEGATPVAMSVLPPSSEGHVYRGPIANGAWVDAAELTPGLRLLNPDQSWAEVISVQTTAEPLKAFNLTVSTFSTYFVSGSLDADPIWVHNVCDSAQFGQTSFRGLNQNRPLANLTDADLQRLFENSPFQLSSHARARIRDPRIRSAGFETPADIQRLLNKGNVTPGRDGTTYISMDGVRAVVNSDTKRIITISPE